MQWERVGVDWENWLKVNLVLKFYLYRSQHVLQKQSKYAYIQRRSEFQIIGTLSKTAEDGDGNVGKTIRLTREDSLLLFLFSVSKNTTWILLKQEDYLFLVYTKW